MNKPPSPTVPAGPAKPDEAAQPVPAPGAAVPKPAGEAVPVTQAPVQAKETPAPAAAVPVKEPVKETPAPVKEAAKEPPASSTAVKKPAAPPTVPQAAPQIAPQTAPPVVTPKAPAVKTNIALVVDDEPANRDFLVRLLQQAKMEVRGASTGAEALQIAESISYFVLVVIDNKLPDMDGVDLLIKLRSRYPEARMIMATMLDERPLMTKAFENGCDVFLVKPHGFMELFRRLQMPDVPGEDKLKRLIIDQYGPRPYRG